MFLNALPPQVVMKWTGHSDYQAMKPYIAIAAADISGKSAISLRKYRAFDRWRWKREVSRNYFAK